jgi:hypothetical protein
VSQRKYKIWTTKDGIRVPISKLGDQHLINILRMLKRMAIAEQNDVIESAGSLMCSVTAEMASYYAEQEFDNAVESDWTEYTQPWFENLEREADRRKLSWEN